jgi:hypothetical protein
MDFICTLDTGRLDGECRVEMTRVFQVSTPVSGHKQHVYNNHMSNIRAARRRFFELMDVPWPLVLSALSLEPRWLWRLAGRLARVRGNLCNLFLLSSTRQKTNGRKHHQVSPRILTVLAGH